MERTLLTDYQCAEKQQIEKNPSLFTVPLKQPLTTTLVSHEHVVNDLNTKLSISIEYRKKRCYFRVNKISLYQFERRITLGANFGSFLNFKTVGTIIFISKLVIYVNERC